MTVAELIAQLQAFDPATPVYTVGGPCDDLGEPACDKIWVDPRGPFEVYELDQRAVAAVRL